MAHIILPPSWRKVILDGRHVDNMKIHDPSQWQVGMILEMTMPHVSGRRYTFRCQVVKLVADEVHLRTVPGDLPERPPEKVIIPSH